MTTTAELEALFDAARARLQGVPKETLGVWRTPRKILGMGAEPRIEPVGEAWHVGALLIGDDYVAAVGEIIRSKDPGRRGYTAESARERAAVRAAALRGRIPEGAVVHVGWSAVDLGLLGAGESQPPISVQDGIPMIRWSAAGGETPLAGYLNERVSLLVDGVGA